MRIRYIKSKDGRAQKINSLMEKKYPALIKEKHPELIFVPGGDGAMLHAIQSFGSLGIPFFGYALGTLNFLMNEINLERLDRTIKGISNNKILLNEVKTSKIRAQLFSSQSKSPVEIGSAVNEVVIGSSVMGYHKFAISSKDKAFIDFDIRGSGLCISTDLGSTGYNFNLGGDVLPLGSNLWSLTGIVCNRYLKDLLHASEVEVSCLCNRSRPTVFLDGIDKRIPLEKGDKIVLKKDKEITLFFLNKDTFLSKRSEIISRYRRT